MERIIINGLILRIRFHPYKNNGNFCDNFTIEHIQPDSEDSSNGQIGNLIPLEESINISCKNKSFNEKIEFYNRSSFVTARNIAKYYKDRKFDANQRTIHMAKEIYDNILKY